MTRKIRPFFLCVTATVVALSAAQPAFKSADPDLSRLIDEVSSERIAASMRKLGSFGTRDLHSATDSPAQGIGAARRGGGCSKN